MGVLRTGFRFYLGGPWMSVTLSRIRGGIELKVISNILALAKGFTNLTILSVDLFFLLHGAFYCFNGVDPY